MSISTKIKTDITDAGKLQADSPQAKLKPNPSQFLPENDVALLTEVNMICK